MSEFKVGDRVKIIDIDWDGNTMYDEYLNEIGTITKIEHFSSGSVHATLEMDNEVRGSRYAWVELYQIELIP